MRRKIESRWSFVLALVSSIAVLATMARAQRPPQQPPPQRPASVDAAAENQRNPAWGAAGIPLLRIVPSDYADGISTPAGPDRPNPRTISNIVAAEPAAIPNPRNASSYLWQWGQFLDHDIDLTETTTDEIFPIAIPAGDREFDPGNTGNVVLFLLRSIYDPASGTGATNPRQQLNSVTAYVDASNVYGSDLARATALRTNDGSGRLKTSGEGLLPLNEDGLPNAGGTRSSLFVAGDVRANEQVGLTALHTLFMREHNRRADAIRQTNPGLSDDEIYRQARQLVAAEMQVITYREFLPILLGPSSLGPYRGYRANIDPSITNMFSTAAFRLGHSMLNEKLLRRGPGGLVVPGGDLMLAESFFFDPNRLRTEGGIEPLLLGLAQQQARRIDPFITGAVRNLLFGSPGQGGFDLPALNIQRGRDHGLADYNSARRAMGLRPKLSFASISSNTEIQRRLELAYGSVDLIDPWIGGLAEDAVRGAMVGEFFFEVLVEQFNRLRDGDPDWYERMLTPTLARQVEQLTLGDIIRLNTNIGPAVPRNVFLAPQGSPF